MRQAKMILAFCVLNWTLGMAWTTVLSPTVSTGLKNTPKTEGLPDEFTPLPNRGVVNNELDHYQAFNSQMDDFMQLDETPGINFTVSRVDTPVVNGTYSCSLMYRNYGKARFPANFLQTYSDPYPNIRDNATFAFNWYLESIDNFVADQDFVRVTVALNVSTQYFRYYLGGYMTQDSNSYSLNVTGHNTPLSWQYTWRNLTQDYIDRWGAISQDIGILSIQIEVDQEQYRSVPIITYLDNMSVVINDANIVQNGDFEDINSAQRPSGWLVTNVNAEYAPGSIKHVTAGMNDTNAVNISTQIDTITNRGIVSYADLAATWLYENRTANNCSNTRPMSLVLNYKIENVPLTEDAWALIRFTFYNETANQYLNFYFYDTAALAANTSNTLNIMLDNRTNIWLSANVDLWPLLSSINYGYSSQLVGLEYEVVCYGDAMDNFSILFDNMCLQTTTFTDAQFEHPFQAGKIGGWSPMIYCLMNYSETRYSGAYSGNFSMDGGYGHIQALGFNYYQAHGLTKGLTFDADYLIPNLNGNVIDGVTWMILFYPYDGVHDLRALAYTLAWNDKSQFSGNGTLTGRIFLTNQLGTWVHFQQNLYNDFRTLFPGESPEDYYMSMIYFHIQSMDYAHPLYFLLDNMDLKIANDPDPPRITAITLTPSPPKAGTPLTITAQVIDDGIGVQDVTLMYSTDTGSSWQSKAMTGCGSNNYCATIENLAENTILNYYIVATDEFGNTAQSMIGGNASMVVVVPAFSFWDAFLIGALLVGGALAVFFIIIMVRQAKKSRAGRAVPAAGLVNQTKLL